MCGIAGLLGPHPDATNDVMDRMLHRISHRGPDDRRTFIDGDTILGFARLSIIDLSPAGGQPIRNEDDTVVALVNGEIYDYPELRAELRAAGHTFRGESDAEVVPHLYEEYGDRFVDRLRGMFAIAIWDVTRARLLLVRDRLGKKPLFFSMTAGGGLAFASEMKALFEVPGGDLGIRPQGIVDYLTHGLVPGPETVYRGIRRVRPAHRLVYQRGRPVFEEAYWRLRCAPKQRIGREEAERRQWSGRSCAWKSGGSAVVHCMRPDPGVKPMFIQVPGLQMPGGNASSVEDADVEPYSDRVSPEGDTSRP